MLKFVKCDRVHEKHVPQMIFVYRLCGVFVLGSFVGMLLGLAV